MHLKISLDERVRNSVMGGIIWARGVYSGLACLIPGYCLVGGYTLGCYTGMKACNDKIKAFQRKLLIWKIKAFESNLRNVSFGK